MTFERAETKDQDLALKIIELSGIDLSIVREENPIRVKGIIGTCSGMIGSRFHGLVSALSQGVPAIATGWSHKYAMLMEDYGFAAGLLPASSPSENIEKSVGLLTEGASYREIADKVKSAALAQKARSVQMWDEVFAIVDSGARR